MGMLNHQKFFIFQARGTKNAPHNGKSHVDAEHYGAIHPMFDSLRAPGHIVSVTMLTVELKRITGAQVSLHVLSKHVACWLVSVLHNMSDTALNNLNTDKPASNMLTQNMQ